MANNQVYTRLCFIFFTLLFLNTAYAQKDHVYLNNGSVIKGTVSEVTPDDVRMNVGESQVNLMISDIRYVKFSKASNLDSRQVSQLREQMRSYFQRGFTYLLSTGLLVGDGELENGNTGMFSAQAAVLYKVIPRAHVGLSLSYDKHYLFNAAPLSVYVRSDIAKKPGGLFAYGSVGMAKMWNNKNSSSQFDNVDGGRVLQFGLGNSWKLNNVELVGTLGWKRQNVEYSNDVIIFDWGGTSNEFVVSRQISRIEIKFGIIF